MKLTYFRHDPPNFGDALNEIMWQELLPSGFLDEDQSDLFLGIGSIIWNDLPDPPRKHVIGSGYGAYTDPPDVHDGGWNIAWVRGPRTAQILGIDPKLAICDAAILLRDITLPPPAADQGVAFMPHFDRAPRADWARICAMAGMTYLDPRDDVVSLLSRLRGTQLLVTEAMHGAIVADALRVPWTAVLPMEPRHRMKWDDWAESLGLELRPHDLPPAHMLELYMAATGLAGKGERSRRLSANPAFYPLNAGLARRAARRLRRIAAECVPQLSGDAAIERATTRSREALERFVRAHDPRMI